MTPKSSNLPFANVTAKVKIGPEPANALIIVVKNQVQYFIACGKEKDTQSKIMACDEPPNSENGLTKNHFTSDGDVGLGLWYANCQLAEIKNFQKLA